MFHTNRKRVQQIFKLEFSKIWVNTSSIVEILYLNVKENRDGREKVIYYFEKANK